MRLPEWYERERSNSEQGQDKDPDRVMVPGFALDLSLSAAAVRTISERWIDAYAARAALPPNRESGIFWLDSGGGSTGRRVSAVHADVPQRVNPRPIILR